jgi:hypothetical protein
MKVALCLHGLVGTDNKYGKGKKLINHKVGFRHFKKHVININEQVDVFIHTWSVDQVDAVTETYKPVAITAEEQPKTDYDIAGKHANFCRWNSVKKVISLMDQADTDYDWVLLTRFDISFLVDFNFSTFDKNKFYAQGPPGPYENGLHLINDLWFCAPPEDMLKFATLFDNLPQYKHHMISNHQLARKHLFETGLHDKLEYKFLREWTGAAGKLSSDTPLVRWHYMNKV